MQDKFGHTADTYDATFTNTLTGKMQRKEVYKYLRKLLKNQEPLKVLELNCGTGEDALYLANQGHNIVATDLSEKMILRATEKLRGKKNVQFQVLDIMQLDALEDKGPYDLIFSNFGGLNCLSPNAIKTQAFQIENLLKREGLFIAVIMGRKCMWESLYFKLKKKPIAAQRRKSKGAVMAHVDGEQVPTWYYSPKEFASFLPQLSVLKLKPVGLLVPTSYLDPFFTNKKRLLHFLAFVSYYLFHPSFMANYADHYFMTLKAKSAQ